MVALQAGSPRTPPSPSRAWCTSTPGRGWWTWRTTSTPGLPLTRESRADLFPAYLDGGRLDAFGRRLLAFPFARSLAVQYYNEDLLGAAGHSGTATLSFEEFRRQVARRPAGTAAGGPSTATTSAWTPPI